MSGLVGRVETWTFFISMLPISELRGAIPFALFPELRGVIPFALFPLSSLSPLKAYLISIAGNILPVLPLLLLLRRLSAFIVRYRIGAVLFDWTVRRAKKREDLVRRYGFYGLILLVAIPLPITGAWTGVLVSFLLSMQIKYAFAAICIGVGLAGIIVLLASLGIMGIIGGVIMEIFGVVVGGIIGIAVLAMVIAGFFMWIGAKIARVDNGTFGRSIIAAIGAAFITWIIALAFSVIPVIGTALGFMFGLIFAILVIKAIYGTTFGKALLVWVFYIIAEVIAIVIGVLTFAGALIF